MPEEEPVKRRALGRGLESLLPRIKAPVPAPPPPMEAAPPGLAGSALEIALDAIERSPYQPRTQFNDQQLIELAASISASGVVQPIVVRPLPGGRYQLIAGERRWLASRLANMSTVPAIVRPASDAQAMEMTIVENLQRSDLNPMEQARAFDRLGREFRLTQEQMAQRTGKDRASIGNFLRLLKLPVVVQRNVESEQLSFGHARALLALEDSGTMMMAADKVLDQALSVRQTETYVQELLGLNTKDVLQKRPQIKEPLDPNVREARDELQRALGLRVTIEDKDGKGRVIIDYTTLEDFDSLVERLVYR